MCVADPTGRGDLGPLPVNADLVPWAAVPARSPDLAGVGIVVVADAGRDGVLDALDLMADLRVIQALSAGVDWLAGLAPDGVVVCNARGVYDAPLAEWVVGAILAMERGLLRARDAQADGAWLGFVPPGELAGSRVVVLGQGSIGSAVADRLRPFGAEVTGVARTRRDGLRGIDDLDAVLPHADVLVNLLPLTRETVGLVDARLLARLPDGALVVNAGRGRTTVTPALVAELASGRLRAVVDVTDPEPLPPDHPLWALPNALVTPHVAGDSPRSIARAFALAGDQVRRFAAGEPLANRVDPYLLEALPG